MSEQAETGLELRDVSAARGGREVLRGIDLTVARGELLVVLGPSGAGKSTLLRVIAGLEPVTGGRVLIAGRDVTELRPGRRNVSMVFQSYALFPHLTVAQNIAFGPLVRDAGRAGALERAQKAAAAVGIGHLLDRRPDQLSGGERQRVALARALVREPDAFLLDEPLSNLDTERRTETRAELKALHRRVGAATVHVTHDQVEALVLGDRVAVLRDGRLEQVGTPDELWHAPATTFVARFVGSPRMNLLPGDGPLRPPDTPPDAGRTLGFRPEAVRLSAVGPGAVGPGAVGPGAVGPGAVEPGAVGPGAARLEATDTPRGIVARVDVVGEDAHAYLRVAGHEVVARVPAADRPVAGAEVGIEVRWDAAHVFDAATGLRMTGE